VTLPRFAASEARKLLAAKPDLADADAWRASIPARRSALVDKVLGGFPNATESQALIIDNSGQLAIGFQPEPGIALRASVDAMQSADIPLAILIDLEGGEKAAASPLAAEAKRAGWRLATLDLRATGKLAWPSDKIGNAPDHNTAEWALWIGRPLLGQWAYDLRRLLDTLEKFHQLPKEVVLIGQGPAGLVALTVAAVDPRITKVTAVGTLASYVTDEPYVGQRLGLMAPGILREVGDVAQLAALIAPRRVVIAGGVGGNGKPVPAEQLGRNFHDAARVWDLLNAGPELSVILTTDPAEIIKRLR
jgi:hypothetical protein